MPGPRPPLFVSQKKSELTILCPADASWDLWRQGAGGFQLAESVPLAEGGGPAGFRQVHLFGCPVISAFAVPLWVASTDPEIIQSAVEMQLEKLNLRPEDSGGRLIDTRTIEQTESQTLVLATVLHEKNLREFPRSIPEQFEITPSLFYLPDNSLVLWRELEKLVVVITRGDSVIYFQALGSDKLDAAAAHELQLLVMQLELQGVVGGLDQIVLWTDAADTEAAAGLQEALGLPVRHQPKPAPALPAVPSGLLPHSIARARAAAARRRRIRQATTAAAALYLVAAGLFAFLSLREVRAASQLKVQRDALEAEVGWVAPEQSRWLRMLDVTHADRYPLERFYQVAKSLDENSKVRLTKFTFEPTKLIVAGEAQDITRAINFMNALTRDPALGEYVWDKNPPKTERTGIASFQITGTLKNAATDIE